MDTVRSKDGTLIAFQKSGTGAPTLLLLGGDSPAFLTAATHLLHETLPNNQLVVMPGQQHTAMNTAPELFVREVFDFLTELA
jgi:pimeloyl-ACP methyl ester carboxylesterase